MEFRIAQISDDPRGVLTGAFVFSPPPHLPDVSRVMVERFGAENTKLGPHGWAVDSRGLRPRVIEKRGAELWLCFGAEVSFHVLPNTPVRVSILGTDIEGTEIWPPIPRGKAPPADIPEDDAPWPEPARAEAPSPPVPPPPAPPPAPAPRKVEEATIIVPPVREQPPPPPAPPPPAPPEPAPQQPKRGLLIGIIAAVLVLVGAGGAAWWFLRPVPAPVEQAAIPPAAPPASPDCAEAADVLSGKCSSDKLRGLPPAEQTRLGTALAGMGDARAGNLAVALLGTAAAANHAPARLALARMYDPISFRPGGGLREPNPTRALDEYGKATEGGLVDARTAREALVARLKQDAAGSDAAAAERARLALSSVGIP